MKQSLRSLTLLATALLIASGAGGCGWKLPGFNAASTPAAATAREGKKKHDPSDRGEPTTGQQLVAAAARQMVKEPSLEAKVRHRININGQELFGTGLYQQLGAGEEKLLRFEMKTQLDDQTATLQEICSDRFYWIRKDLPQGGKSLSRVSLWQLRDAIRRAEEIKPIAGANRWMMLGGLSRLLEEINRSYDFRPPQPGHLGSVPVWVINGEATADFRQKLNIEADTVPPQFPSHITLTLGRDNILPLFPYRLEYQQGRGEGAKTLMSMELFEVRRRSDLDPRSFEYNPGDQEVEDVTRTCLTRLGLMK